MQKLAGGIFQGGSNLVALFDRQLDRTLDLDGSASFAGCGQQFAHLVFGSMEFFEAFPGVAGIFVEPFLQAEDLDVVEANFIAQNRE